jgi:hypothetical protein
MMISPNSNEFLEGKAYYFNAFYGFGSDLQCSHQRSKMHLCPGPNYSLFCNQFCWLWNIPGPWRAVDTTSHVHSHMEQEASIVWLLAPYLLILCATTALIGSTLLLLSLRMSSDYQLFLSQYLRQLSADDRLRQSHSHQRGDGGTNTYSTICSSLYRRTCFNVQNTAIFCFFLTSLFSHGLFLGLSLSDTLNAGQKPLSHGIVIIFFSITISLSASLRTLGAIHDLHVLCFSIYRDRL